MDKEKGSMRTLEEIIDSAKNGEMPTHEECYYAMLVYEAMFNIDHRHLREVLLSNKPQTKITKTINKLRAENSFNMYKGALNKPPKEWLGWHNDPTNPNYQKMRKITLEIFHKIAKKIEEDE